MRDSKSSGKKPIKEVQELRARKPKLERVSSDIAERKKAEEELRQSKEFLANMIDALDDPVFVKDEQHRWVILNDAACKVMGRSREELIGKSDYDLFSKQQADVFWERDELVLKNGRTDINEEEITWHGKLHTISTKKSLFPDSVTGKKFIVGTIRDITERKRAEGEIRKFKTICDRAGYGVAMSDVEGNLIYVNRSFAQMHGYTADELIGKNLSLFHNQEQMKNVNRLNDKLRREGSFIAEEVWHKREDDTVFPTLMHGILIRDEKRKPLFMAATAVDITERKKAEEELEAGKKKLETYIESMVDGVAVADFRNRLIQANKALAELLGYDSVNEMLGMDTADLVPKREISRIMEAGKECIKKGTLRNFETIALRKDGWEVPVQLNATALKDPSGKLVGNMSVIRDITDRKRAEEALRKSEQKYRTLYETTRDGIAGGPMDGRILEYNQAFVDMLGYSREELSSLTYQQLTPKRWHQMEAEIVEEQILKRGYSDEYEKEYIRKDGTVFPISARVYLVRDEDGKPVGMWGIVRDITERKRAEEAYRALVDHSLQGLLILQDGHAVFANQAMTEITGYTVDEILAMSSQQIRAFVHPEDRALVWGRHRGRLKGQQLPERYEFRGIRKDATVCWLEIHASRIEYRGKPAIQAAYVDITDRKRAEQALKESEQRYRTIFESMTDSLFILDVKGERFVEVNPAACKMYGYTHDEFLELTPSTLVHPDCALLFGEFLETTEADGTFHTTSVDLRKDGTPIDVQVDGRMISYQGKAHLLAVVRDITDRKKAEEKIARIAKFPAENPNPVLRVAKDGTIIYANKASQPLLGQWRRQTGQRLPAKWYQHASEAFSSDSAKEVEVECECCTLSLTFAPVVDFGYVNIYGLDITERKQVEQRLLEDQVKLKSLTSQLTLAEERERHRIATELHDRISQSLVISKMNLEALRKSGHGKKTDETLDEICNLLGQTIADTRTLTFDLSSPILYELGFEVAVAEWLTEQIRDKHGIATQFEDDGRPKPLDDDIRVLLFRDVRELLINVVRHARADKVKVSIRRVGSQIQVSVEDDGVGFDPAKAASTAAKRAEFGLFSIRQRLEELGGRLEIESEPGRGCKVTMTAPLKQK